MDWTQTILDFLAAVSWPVLAAVVLWRLWPKLADLVDRIKSVKAGGTEVALWERTEAAAASLHAIGDGPVDAEGLIEPTEEELETVRLARADLEGIVRSFAEAGWAMGSLGVFKSEPTPIVRWTEDGRPYVAHWKGERATAPSLQTRGRARELEQAIEDLEVKTRSGARSALAIGPDRTRLEVLKEKLRGVDPTSPWSY